MYPPTRADADSDALELHRFAIQEGIRSLEHQDTELGRLRDRVVQLLGLTATASAFLVGSALKDSSRGAKFFIPLAVGTGGLVCLIICAWLISRPVVEWSQKVTSEGIVDHFTKLPSHERYTTLAHYYASAQAKNEVVLDSLRTAMQAALISAGVSLMAFICLIWLVG